MRLVPFTLLCLAFTTTAFARLGDTLDQAEIRYGLEKQQKYPSSTSKLLDGAREVTFEFQGWRIRCALLQATDGNFYVVREEYSKIFNGEIMKAGGVIQIRDFERDVIFQAETGSWVLKTLGEPGSDLLSSAANQLLRLYGVTKVWTRSDGAIARVNSGGINVILDLPQALKFEAELKGIKDQKARELTSHLAPPETGERPSQLPGPVTPETQHQKAQSPPPTPVTMKPLLPKTPSRPPSVTTVPAFPTNAPVFTFSILASIVPLGTLALIATVAVFLARQLSRTSSRKRSANPSVSNSRAGSPPPIPPTIPKAQPTSRTVKDLTWDEFELLVGEIYRRQGFTVELSAGTGADGGIDLTLHRVNERVLVQCKSWNAYKVSAKEIREFFGVLVSEKAARGIFITTGQFTRDAMDFADRKPIEMIDGPAFEQLQRAASADPNVDLLNVGLWAPVFLAASIVVTPNCPFCKTQMVRRDGRTGAFWGCPTYPRCRGKREMRQHFEMCTTK